MAQVFSKEDFRTLNDVKGGFLEGIFDEPEYVAKHMKPMFGDGEIKVIEKQPNYFIINCKSYDWCISANYNRTFKFTFERRADGTNKILNVEEL